jgi:Tfp pilus assembly protein PilF
MNMNVKMLDRLGDFDASQRNYVSAMEELDPLDRDAYLGRAGIFKRLGNIELSEDGLQKAAALR